MDQKKLKIAFLCRYLGIVNRGVETYILELSKRLRKNHKVDLLSGKESDSVGKILAGKYNLVVPTNGRLQSLKASIGRITGGYKTLISGQAGIGKDDIWNIAVTAPDVFVALTDAELGWAKHFSWKTKIVKIPNGVDLDKFSPNGPNIDLNLPRPIVLSVGALEWYKYHERAIYAMVKLNQGSLLIIGSGPLYNKLCHQGNSLLGKSRFQIASVPFAQMPRYYRSADLFTLPSWDREAFGIVYVEALASGLPVVAPNDLARREIVGEAGLLVDVSDVDKYTSAMSQALSRNWHNLPRKQAEQFSWDKIAQKYEELFKELF